MLEGCNEVLILLLNLFLVLFRKLKVHIRILLLTTNSLLPLRADKLLPLRPDKLLPLRGDKLLPLGADKLLLPLRADKLQPLRPDKLHPLGLTNNKDGPQINGRFRPIDLRLQLM